MQMLMKVSEVAALLRYSRKTVSAWAREGLLPGAVLINGTIRFDPEKLLAFIGTGGGGETIFQIQRHGARAHAGGALASAPLPFSMKPAKTPVELHNAPESWMSRDGSAAGAAV